MVIPLATERVEKEESPMKKWLILCMAMVLSLALLAGCDSADPNNPYGQEPAPATNSESEDESTSAVPFFFEV